MIISDPVIWISVIVMFAAGFITGWMLMERKAVREWNDFLDDIVAMEAERKRMDPLYDQEQDQPKEED